jgi:hypothetical protein
MRKVITARQALMVIKSFKFQVTRAVVRSEKETLEKAHELLIKQSSGKISTKELRRMGHPFARRAPQDSPPADIINSQSGEFKGKWRNRGVKTTSKGTSGKVRNISRKAGFMHGTPLMVKRSVVEAVKKKIRRQRRQRLRKYLNEGILKSIK